MDMKDILSGTSFLAYKTLGAHLTGNGVRFSVFAPNAENVSLIGEFSDWKDIPMEKDKNGVWCVTEENAREGQMYKFRIETENGEISDRIDPFAFFSEKRPGNASVIYNPFCYEWNDDDWILSRKKNFSESMNIYEVHLGSFMKKDDGEFLSYEETAEKLIPYVKSIGADFIEFMPFTEYPLDASWGYQVSGYYSATSRYGNPDGLKKLIEKCHQNGIGVIMDFVPLHFVSDYFALNCYDGTHIFESDEETERHSRWGTMLFDFTKPFVMSFLHSAVTFFIENYHIDGIRFDAVSDMIYRYGNGDEGLNEPAIWFMKTLNYYISKKYEGVMLIAEDSSIFGKVTAPVEYGGLGFDYKWDLGWMNNTLYYLSLPFEKREYKAYSIHHSMDYFYNENYILPLSHDEVSHGKKSLINKFYGDFEERFLQFKLLLVYAFTHPGKKLFFMGTEIPSEKEWNEYDTLDWGNTRREELTEFFKELSSLYKKYPSLYKNDYDSRFFRWIERENDECLFIFERLSDDGDRVKIAINFSDEKVSKKIFLSPDEEIILSSGKAEITRTKTGATIKLGKLSSAIIGKK